MKSDRAFLPIHPEGWVFIVVFAAGAWALSAFGGWWLALGAVLLAWCVYFFRDPPRVTPKRPGVIVSPGDGKVVAVVEAAPDESLGLGPEARVRISIFLNVFDVHVNRSPADGTVTQALYRPGKFINAARDKASVDNERMALVLTLADTHPWAGQTLGVVQIAGLIARRIVCTARPGDKLRAGERYGIIRFGSRVDVYLPPGLRPLVEVGQSMLGGETVLAEAVPFQHT